jgi:hypothetical protein
MLHVPAWHGVAWLRLPPQLALPDASQYQTELDKKAAQGQPTAAPGEPQQGSPAPAGEPSPSAGTPAPGAAATEDDHDRGVVMNDEPAL